MPLPEVGAVGTRVGRGGGRWRPRAVGVTDAWGAVAGLRLRCRGPGAGGSGGTCPDGMLCFPGGHPRTPVRRDSALTMVRASVRHTSRFSVRTRTSYAPDPLPPVVPHNPPTWWGYGSGAARWPRPPAPAHGRASP
ncbi:hypothetical protein CU044_7324 [Streptomyces sp. L-9-10]|nr:hypothetical protein CU044_7324 [Streptomyces sp. L-9-10]